MKNVCTFGLVLEQKVKGIERNMQEGFENVIKRLEKVDETQKELFNHMSSRPTRESARLITILTGVICTLLGVLGTFVIAMLKYS